MTPKEFKKFLARDLHCLHCGADGDDLVPQHRLNRGAGGKNSKADRSSNIIVFCSYANGLAESNAQFADVCRLNGWKLRSWQNPSDTPVLDAVSGLWWRLDDKFGRVSMDNLT